MASSNTPTVKPKLRFWQIWNMSFGFLGIQFGFALQNANTSRIFTTLGSDPSSLALYWAAAPITGFLIQPIIGYYSDRTWSPTWGRRRPYFAIGALLASLALLLMPNSSSLWMAVSVLWIMDASINVSMEPFRAFVGDILPPSQRTTGFAMQSFFIGTGAVVASFLPQIFTNWFSISNTPPLGGISDSVKYSFYIGAFMLFTAVMWTVFSTKEYPPEPHHNNLRNREKRKIDDEDSTQTKMQQIGFIFLVIGIVLAWVVNILEKENELYILAILLSIFGIVHLLASFYISQGRSYLGIVHMVNDFHSMPKTMVQLALVQFFSWFALFSMWIYTTPAVTSYIYNTNDPNSATYNEGANWVGSLFGIYNGIAAVAALLLPVLAKYTSRRVTHFVALVCGGIGLISFLFISDPNMLLVSMVGVGIAWASILSIPYAMLSGSLPPEKMGYYMGIFNFFIVIPQILASAILGFMLRNIFGGQTISIIVFGGGCMIIAALLSLRVRSSEEISI